MAFTFLLYTCFRFQIIYALTKHFQKVWCLLANYKLLWHAAQLHLERMTANKCFGSCTGEHDFLAVDFFLVCDHNLLEVFLMNVYNWTKRVMSILGNCKQGNLKQTVLFLFSVCVLQLLLHNLTWEISSCGWGVLYNIRWPEQWFAIFLLSFYFVC